MAEAKEVGEKEKPTVSNRERESLTPRPLRTLRSAEPAGRGEGSSRNGSARSSVREHTVCRPFCRFRSYVRDDAILPPGIEYFLEAFVKRTLTSQKINKIGGSMLRIKYKVVLNKAGDRCCPIPTAESSLSGRFEGPKKKEPAAMNRP